MIVTDSLVRSEKACAEVSGTMRAGRGFFARLRGLRRDFAQCVLQALWLRSFGPAGRRRDLRMTPTALRAQSCNGIRITDRENTVEISEFVAAVWVVGAEDCAGGDFSVSRLSQAGAFARRGADAEFFRGARIAWVFPVHLRGSGNVWRRVTAAGIIYARGGAVAGNRDVRGHLEGAQRARVFGGA